MEDLNHPLPERASRRRFFAQAIALIASAPIVQAVAANRSGDHQHHSGAKHTALVESALDCISTGQFCRDHCIAAIRAGDTTLVDCLAVVTDTLAICQTLVQFAASDNRHLPAFAAVCIEVCQDCENECRRHKETHAECRACMDSCRDCIGELRKLVA